jgi:cysteine synthase
MDALARMEQARLLGAEVVAKLEARNPGGSVTGRIGLGMFAAAERHARRVAIRPMVAPMQFR